MEGYPKFQNEVGAPIVYLNMGDASDIVCPYCSTLSVSIRPWVHAASGAGGKSFPACCIFLGQNLIGRDADLCKVSRAYELLNQCEMWLVRRV